MSDGLEQPVASRPTSVRLGKHQRLVDEAGEGIENGSVAAFGSVLAIDSLGGLQREATRKDRKPPEDCPLLVPQETEAPVEGRLQSSLSRHRDAGAPFQQRELVVDTFIDCADRHASRARRYTLDGQRNSVQSLANPGHGRCIAIRDAKARTGLRLSLI